MCWWEDEGLEPWEYSGPNGQTLVEAQQKYLSQRLPHRLRSGKVRSPQRGEERDADWEPWELTEEVIARMEQATAEWQRSFAEDDRRLANQVTDDTAGPLKEYNAAVRALKSEAAHLPHHEVKSRFRELSHAHGLMFGSAELELLSRLIQDESYYRRHPVRTIWWLVRCSRPRSFRRRWEEIRTGSIRLAG